MPTRIFFFNTAWNKQTTGNGFKIIPEKEIANVAFDLYYWEGRTAVPGTQQVLKKLSPITLTTSEMKINRFCIKRTAGRKRKSKCGCLAEDEWQSAATCSHAAGMQTSRGLFSCKKQRALYPAHLWMDRKGLLRPHNEIPRNEEGGARQMAGGWKGRRRGEDGKKKKCSNGKTKAFPLLLACYCLSSWPRLSTYSSPSTPERCGPENQQNANNCSRPRAEHLREPGTAPVASSDLVLLTVPSCRYRYPHVIWGRWGSEASSTSLRPRGAAVAGAGFTRNVSPQPVLSPTAPHAPWDPLHSACTVGAKETWATANTGKRGFQRGAKLSPPGNPSLPLWDDSHY